MPVTLADDEIEALIAERKILAPAYHEQIRLRPKRGHKEAEVSAEGQDGNCFRVIVRQSNSNAMDFSVILAFCPPNTNLLFRLRRYNGKSHEHTNPLEGSRFYGFHIHQATYRYQELGAKEDTFAEVTDRYADVHDALACLLKDCGFELGEEYPGLLFPVPHGPRLEDAEE